MLRELFANADGAAVWVASEESFIKENTKQYKFANAHEWCLKDGAMVSNPSFATSTLVDMGSPTAYYMDIKKNASYAE